MSRTTTKFGDFAVNIEWQQFRGGKFPAKRVTLRRAVIGEFQKRDKVIVYVEKRGAEELVFTKDGWQFKHAITQLLHCVGATQIELAVSNGDIYSIAFADLVEKRQPGKMGNVIVPMNAWTRTQGDPASLETEMKVGKWK